jgi:rhamnosyltransferase
VKKESLKPKVSVIMRTKNSDWVVQQALKSLYSQTFLDFELIIVDSGSTDKTLDIIKHNIEEYKEIEHRLTQIEAVKYYPGPVLNFAVEQAKADIIIFQNSDSVFLTPLTLQRMVDAFDKEEAEVVLSRQLPRPEADTWVLKDYEISFPNSDETPPWITLSLPLAGFKKSLWSEHKFYDDAWASEDTEWGNWAKSRGVKIKYLKESLTMHSHNYTLKQIYGRRFVEGEADVFIYKKFDNLLKFSYRLFRTILSDSIYHLKKLDFIGLALVFPRRFVYQYAYYRGQKLGEERYLSGNKDTSLGQINVLSRY